MMNAQQLPSNVRIYATAYRSMTLPCDADFAWASMSPVDSIGSWGCSIIDRVELDSRDPTVRSLHLVPATPGTRVTIREKLVRVERTPAGEKGTVVYENIDAGAASPYPVQLVEMSTSLSVSRITTLASPLGRCFVELRATFIVMSPEDAAAMTAFVEGSIYDPLLHSAAEMMVPVHPFRDAMFHSVMRHFETSLEKLACASRNVVEQQSHHHRRPVVDAGGGGGGGANEPRDSGVPAAAALISVDSFAKSAVSIAQELYSAWLETSRELRRVEKEIERRCDADDALRAQQLEQSGPHLASASHHHMSSRYRPDEALARRSRETTTASRPRMTDVIALNPNNMFGRHFEMSTAGTYISSSPMTARLGGGGGAEGACAVPAVGSLPMSGTRSVVMSSAACGWQQEVFDDEADATVAEDAVAMFDGRGALMEAPPPPPPRRVLRERTATH